MNDYNRRKHKFVSLVYTSKLWKQFQVGGLTPIVRINSWWLVVGVCYNFKSQSMYKFLKSFGGLYNEDHDCLFTDELLCMSIQRFSHHCSAHTKNHPCLCDLCILMTLKKLQKAKQITYFIVYKSRK